MNEAETTLAEQILADARKQAEPILRRARREAERIQKSAQEDAQRESEQAQERAGRRAELLLRRTEARARLDAENIRRSALEGILLQVRDRAAKSLSELADSPQYPDVLVGLAEDAARQMASRSIELLMRAPDRERHGAYVAGALRERLGKGASGGDFKVAVSDETVRGSGGLLVRSADGRTLCDETFEARLARMWEELREQVAAELFTDGADAKAPEQG